MELKVMEKITSNKEKRGIKKIVVAVVVGSMSVHDKYSFNTSSQLKTVQDPFFSLENLQPGRNYSISVRALSNNIESLAITVFQATRESSFTWSLFLVYFLTRYLCFPGYP